MADEEKVTDDRYLWQTEDFELDDIGVSDAEKEREKDLSLIAAAEEHTSAMIALIPSETDLTRLALEKGEPKEELHLTLWFLGEASDYSQDTRDQLETDLRSAIYELDICSVTGRAFGINHWNPESDDPAWVLAIGNVEEGNNLEDFKAITQESFANIEDLQIPYNHTPWCPHVTLAYDPDLDTLKRIGFDKLGEITFDKIRLAFGGEVRDISLAKKQEK